MRSLTHVFARSCGVLALAVVLAGCASRGPTLTDEVRLGPVYKPTNFAGVPALPAELRRVMILPVYTNGVAPEETAVALEGIIMASVLRAQRFEAVALNRADCLALFGRREFSTGDALPNGMLERLGELYGVGAVLFVDLTSYQPYQPQVLGLRARLAMVPTGEVLWSFDEVLSAADAAVRNSARRRYFEREHGMRPFDLSLAGLQSPSWFAAFVADEMFVTLPPR